MSLSNLNLVSSTQRLNLKLEHCASFIKKHPISGIIKEFMIKLSSFKSFNF
jgi:hypothetical protein